MITDIYDPKPEFRAIEIPKGYVEVSISVLEVESKRRSKRWGPSATDEQVILSMLQAGGIRMVGTTDMRIDDPYVIDNWNGKIVVRQGPANPDAPRTTDAPAQRLQDKFGLSAVDLKAAVKPLFMAMLDHGITTVSVERTGNKAMLTVDGKVI